MYELIFFCRQIFVCMYIICRHIFVGFYYCSQHGNSSTGTHFTVHTHVWASSGIPRPPTVSRSLITMTLTDGSAYFQRYGFLVLDSLFPIVNPEIRTFMDLLACVRSNFCWMRILFLSFVHHMTLDCVHKI